jgi:hypothetical protein
MRRILTVFLTLIASAAWAAPLAVPGTKVALEPPPGFAPAKQFPGFLREDVSASIMVTELPGPVAEMKKAMTKENLQTKGMVLLESNTVQHGGTEALLLSVHQSAAGTLFRKWMLITGAANSTTMVVGTFPDETSAELSEPVKAAVLSTTITSAAAAQARDLFEGLLFRVQPSAKLKIATRVGNTLLLNETGTMEPVKGDGALYVVGNSVADAAIGDLGAFAKARANKTAQIKDLRNIAERRVKLDGLEASEIVADAIDPMSGAPLRFYQVIAPDKGGYFIVQGLVGAQRGKEFLGQFREVTGSFKRARE